MSEASGWVVHQVRRHYINIVKYNPPEGSSYIKLPAELQHAMKGLINIKNDDNQCFRWCHIRRFNPQEMNPQRIKKSDRLLVDNYDYTGVEFPVSTKHYSRIEAQSKVNVNVLGYENKHFFPIYISTGGHEELNLLLLSEGEKQHYVRISNFIRLMRNHTKHNNKKHFCMHCVTGFISEEVLAKHKENCISINGRQGIQMPRKGSKVQFQDHHRQMPVPFVIYADFEAITEKVSGCQPIAEKSFTDKYQQHTACSYGYKLVCCYDDYYSKPVKIYRGEEPVNKFMREMIKEVDYCKATMRKHFRKSLVMSYDDEEMFKATELCHICGEQYKKKDVRVRGHCHVKGNYRGSAHQDCNLKLKLNPSNVKIPVIFHNVRWYDAHFIMQVIGKISKGQNLSINCIPNNMEYYMAFTLGNNLVFLDSFQFMASSLDRLAPNLPEDKYKYTSGVFKNEQLTLMKGKGVYPYNCMDSFQKFGYNQLPNRRAFGMRMRQYGLLK